MKLQGKLVVVIVVAIVASMLLLATVVFTQLRQRSELELFSQMQLLLDKTQQQTQSFIQNTEANTRLFSSSNLMDRYVMVEDEADRYDLMQPALLRLFTKYQQAYPEYQELRLILPDGYEDTRIASPGLDNITEEELDTPYFKSMVESDLNSMSTIIKNPDDGKTTLLVSVPIYRKDLSISSIAATPVLRGFMVVTASLKFLEKQIENQKIGTDGYLVAIDRQQRVVYHPILSMIGTDATSLSQALSAKDSTPNASDISRGTVLTNYQNTSVYVRGLRVHPDLMLLSVLPASEFRNLSTRLAITVALISIGAIILTSLTLFFLLRKLVISPVRQLSQLAVAIGEGRSANVKGVNLQREDEIGDLARAFQDMNLKLGHSMQQLQQSHAKIEQLAYRDSLTGLPNRRLFLELVERAISNSYNDDQHGALLFLDLDDFKKVNDTLGHEAGDKLLKEVGSRLIKCLRESDITARVPNSKPDASDTGTVARLGGDEFIMLLRNLKDPLDAAVVAERVLRALSQPVLLSGQEFVVGTSIGISTFSHNSKNDVETLVKCADMAMYEAKREEKNTFRFYRENMQRSLQELLSIERDFRIAVEEQSLHLHFQPQFDTKTEQLSGVEVLLRWHHFERGNIPPDRFIPIAEETGLIGVLGEWIIDESCAQWSLWNEQGIAPPRLAVNVSQRQFKLSNLVEVIKRALTRNDMPAEALEIEITESCMMEASTDVLQTLAIIRELGVRISMDDFGTGYSSLSALATLPIDTLKIDRSFVTGLEIGKPNEKIVSAIISLAHSLCLDVVGEGVETRSEHQYLLQIGCRFCQGYLFSKPLSATQMTERLVRDEADRQNDLFGKTG